MKLPWNRHAENLHGKEAHVEAEQLLREVREQGLEVDRVAEGLRRRRRDLFAETFAQTIKGA